MTPIDIVRLGFFCHLILFSLGAVFHYLTKENYEPFNFAVPNITSLLGCGVILTIYAYSADFEALRTLIDFAGAAIYFMVAVLWLLGAAIGVAITLGFTKFLNAN
jgi:hypothetical protein